jgi:DNA helicase HerA-like ATPase
MDQVFSQKGYVAGKDSAVRKIIHEGRHYGVSLMGTFRRTSNVAEDLISQCDHVFLFRTTPTCPQDLVTIRQRFGEPYAAAVSSLDVRKFLHWTDA